jgi:hypothetical protein
MFDHIAPIYKTLVYNYLEPKDLASLGKTCKVIHGDTNRKDMIVKKLSSTFGYKVDKYYWKYGNYYDYESMSKDMIILISIEYKKKMLSLKLKDVEDMTFLEKRYLVICSPIHLFLILDKESQKEIINIFCRHIYDMIIYANQRGMKIKVYDYRCDEEFDLYPFMNHVNHHLENIFKKSGEEIRYHLIQKLIDVRASLDVSNPKSKNVFSEMEFIYLLYHGDFLKIDKLIEVALFLQKYLPGHLSDYLDVTFGEYLESTDDTYEDPWDIHAKDIDKILDNKNKTYPEQTNAEVLDELLLECKLFSVNLIRNANEKRWKRHCASESS